MKARIIRFYIFLYGIMLVGFFPVFALDNFPDLAVDFRGVSGITLTYSPMTDGIAPVQSGEVWKLDLPYHGAAGLPGGYKIPFRKHLIAIPLEADVSLSIIQQKTHSMANVELERIPLDSTFTGQDNDIIFDNVEQFVTVSAPFRYRRFRVVEVVLRPVVYNPAAHTLTVVDELQIRIDFQGGAQSYGSEPHSQRLKSLILNYEQAKNWAYPPGRNLSSSLPGGNLFKIPVTDEGIYRITYDLLDDMNLNLEDYPLDLISVYNNGGRTLSTVISAPTVDSLIENAIYAHDEDGDNIFNEEDYILFYGRGTWELEETSPGYYAHYKNPYTYENTYWLELKQTGILGKRMSEFGSQSSASVTVQTTKARVWREDEKVIYGDSKFPGSGLTWYGDLFTGSTSKSYSHNFQDVASGDYKIRIVMKVIASTLKIKVYLNNTLIDSISTSNVYEFTGTGVVNEGINTLKLVNSETGGSYGSAYLDWYEIEYTRYIANESQSDIAKTFFESPLGSGTVQYDSLIGFSDSAFVFDISQFDDVQYTRGKRFKDDISYSSTVRYFACEESAFEDVENIYSYSTPPSDFIDLREIGNQADYLFIVHPDFFDGLDNIVSLWESQDGMIVKRVNVNQIYDQFSCGLYDPAAIRNFLRFAVDNWNVPPFFTALTGDGDYDFLNRISSADNNWIPPYESGATSYDDFYAYLHESFEPEVALGRYTVTSTSELSAVVDKITKYVEEPEFGPWRLRFTIVADDEFGEGGGTGLWEQNHVEQSESLADNYLPWFLNRVKIYLTEYPLSPGAGGRQKPLAGEDLVESINQGTIMVNYFGHGNEWVWAHETVFNVERDLPLIDNSYKLPFFVAFTCTWAYFDNPQKQSMPEMLFTMPSEGAIGCIGASRSTGPDPNWGLAQAFYSEMFEDPLNPKPVGEALMIAKVNCGGPNSEKYHIIGDPMLVIGTPRNSGQISGMSPDSLFALNLMELSGTLFQGMNPWTSFDDTVYLDVKDAAIPVVYQFANSNNTVQYELPGNTIFRGPFTASGGGFSAKFVVPIDITYGGELGRISLYYSNGEQDGCVYRDSIYIGAGGVELQDSDVPYATIYFGDKSYRPGDAIATSPLIIVDLCDSSGINLTGSAGHEIMLIADEDSEFDLTQYFEYHTDSYTMGTVKHQLEYLSPGTHQMKFRVWDSFNNPYQYEFTVEATDISPEEDFLSDILNYPNPFSDTTVFTFKIIEAAEVEIKIYTVAGRMIKSLGPKYCLPVFIYDQFMWDGRDAEGDKVANGVYLYKVKANFIGESVSKIGRIIVMR